MPDVPVLPLRRVTKKDAEREHKNSLVRASCEAGIDAVLENPSVSAALELLDGVSAALLTFEANDVDNAMRGQLLKSAGSIAANLAEGVGRAYTDDKRKFWLNARGSAYETVIWLRAYGKRSLEAEAIALCRRIDTDILATLDDVDAE